MEKRTALLIALFILSGFGDIAFASCTDRVKEFYLQYMSNIAGRFDREKDKELKEIYLTEDLVNKSIPEMIERTDADPIIRAQDMNKTGIETLAVKSLGNDWYMVSYYWKKGDESTLTQIPVKTTGAGDDCKICYITPLWEGLKYGKELVIEEGKITDTYILRSSCPEFEEAALRIVNEMPDWNPGSYSGKPITVKNFIPVNFRLKD